MAKVMELEARLSQNSRNSHRPPSSDAFKKRSSAMPKKKKGKSGGQKGHKGDTLKMVNQAYKYEPLLPDRCRCGAKLDKELAQVIEKRQVFDLPEPRLKVTEYQQLSCLCPKCGSVNRGTFPDHLAVSPVQYGSRTKALVSLLRVYYKLPLRRISELFGDLFDQPINESTIVSATRQCHELLAPAEQAIGERLQESPVNHADETGLRCQGKNHWLHTCSNALYTLLYVHPGRGGKAIQASESILPGYRGWLVHDCWPAYFQLEGCKHAICHAHLLRELKALEEQGSHWARSMRRLIWTVYHHTEEGRGTLPRSQLERVQVLFHRILEWADVEEPPPKKTSPKSGRLKRTKGRNLLERLRKRESAVWAFARYEEVSFTNNQAERDIRPAKVKIKVSGCFRTFQGAQVYARIQGMISTLRKHQTNVFKELTAVFNHQPISILG